jgi:hypothetical protein
MCYFSQAYRLAGSFNLRGRLKQLFHVLTDDKIGSGPRLAPHSLQGTQKGDMSTAQVPVSGAKDQATATAQSPAEPMVAGDTVDSDGSVAGQPHTGKAVKRKAEDSSSSRGKNKRQP